MMMTMASRIQSTVLVLILTVMVSTTRWILIQTMMVFPTLRKPALCQRLRKILTAMARLISWTLIRITMARLIQDRVTRVRMRVPIQILMDLLMRLKGQVMPMATAF